MRVERAEVGDDSATDRAWGIARGRVAREKFYYACLAAEWALMRLVPVPGYGTGQLDPFGNMGAYTPEARLEKLTILMGGGALLSRAGLLLNPNYPLNKKIWTPTYMLLSAGFCLAGLALHHWVFDRPAHDRRLLRLTLAARIFGANPIPASAFSTVITTMATRVMVSGVDGQLRNLPAAAYGVLSQMLALRNAF